MELRHLDAVLAIAEEGSFTAAADVLATVQSNVSEQVRQLEAELGARAARPQPPRGRSRPSAARSCSSARGGSAASSRRCAPTSRCCRGSRSATRASASSVPRAGGWCPQLVADLRRRAPGVHLRVVEAASERLVAEVLSRRAHAGDRHRAGRRPPPERRDASSRRRSSASCRRGRPLPAPPVSLAALAELGLVLPPPENPLRLEIEAARGRAGVDATDVSVEVEGIRLIADLVAAGAGASVLPETAVPPELEACAPCRCAACRRGGSRSSTARDAYLSIADRAVRELPARRRSPRDGSPRHACRRPPGQAVRATLAEEDGIDGRATAVGAAPRLSGRQRSSRLVLIVVVVVLAVAELDDVDGRLRRRRRRRCRCSCSSSIVGAASASSSAGCPRRRERRRERRDQRLESSRTTSARAGERELACGRAR